MMVTYNNETKSLREWCDELNLSYNTIYNRIKYQNMDPVDALNKPVCKRFNQIEYNGKMHSVEELCKKYKINKITLYNRIFDSNWDIERALKTPIKKAKTYDTSNIEYNGEVKSLSEWASYYNMEYLTLYQLIFHHKKTMEELFNERENCV
jgi:hypothetical protein